MRALKLSTCCLLIATLGACDLAGKMAGDQPSFEGQRYRTKLSKVDGQRAVFTVAISPASASVSGALEAGRYAATRYCIASFGSSDIIWTSGPDQDPETAEITGDTLVLSGACPR